MESLARYAEELALFYKRDRDQLGQWKLFRTRELWTVSPHFCLQFPNRVMDPRKSTLGVLEPGEWGDHTHSLSQYSSSLSQYRMAKGEKADAQDVAILNTKGATKVEGWAWPKDRESEGAHDVFCSIKEPTPVPPAATVSKPAPSLSLGHVFVSSLAIPHLPQHRHKSRGPYQVWKMAALPDWTGKRFIFIDFGFGRLYLPYSFLTSPAFKGSEIKVLIKIIQMRQKCQPALEPH